MQGRMKIGFSAVAKAVYDQVEHSRATSQISQTGCMTFFDCIEEPALCIVTFMRLLRRLLKVEEWIVAVILMNRATQKAGVALNIFNAHRLLIAAALTSVKMHRIVVKATRAFSDVLHIPLAEINELEVTFLVLIDMETRVSRVEFEHTSYCIAQMAPITVP
eukprot:Hpha_TRINITY_DN16614_c1_g2::TRINITY_DN16614_c1_g2_i1::g.180747::m.180747